MTIKINDSITLMNLRATSSNSLFLSLFAFLFKEMKKISARTAQTFQPRLDKTRGFTIIIPRLRKKEGLNSLFPETFFSRSSFKSCGITNGAIEGEGIMQISVYSKSIIIAHTQFSKRVMAFTISENGHPTLSKYNNL